MVNTTSICINISAMSCFQYITSKKKPVGYSKCNQLHLGIFIYLAGYLQDWAQGLDLHFNLVSLFYFQFICVVVFNSIQFCLFRVCKNNKSDTLMPAPMLLK